MNEESSNPSFHVDTATESDKSYNKMIQTFNLEEHVLSIGGTLHFGVIIWLKYAYIFIKKQMHVHRSRNLW